MIFSDLPEIGATSQQLPSHHESSGVNSVLRPTVSINGPSMGIQPSSGFSMPNAPYSTVPVYNSATMINNVPPSANQINYPFNYQSGMPLTTPINLPGMPPITVSATLPIATLECLQVIEAEKRNQH